MADVVKAWALVVCIGPIEVLMPGVAATKMDFRATRPPHPPPHTHTERGPIVLPGCEGKTSKMIAEPRPDKKKKKQGKRKKKKKWGTTIVWGVVSFIENIHWFRFSYFVFTHMKKSNGIDGTR